MTEVRKPPQSSPTPLIQNIGLALLIARAVGNIDLHETMGLIEVPSAVVALEGPEAQARLGRLGLV